MKKNESTYIEIGRVQAAQGIRGELYVSLRVAEAPWLGQLKMLRLQPGDETAIDFRVIRARVHKHGFVVQVEGVTDRNAAEAMRGWRFFLPAELLVAKSGDSIFLGEILNFELWYQASGDHISDVQAPVHVGFVRDFSFNGAQDLLVVELLDAPGESVEIPFVTEFVVTMDAAQRRLVLQCPAEFLDATFWRSKK
jgi:16S rRNA processing protein RimM